MIEMQDKQSFKDVYVPQGRKAPNGAYWKFDCSWIQKFTLSNCWQGDDGRGKTCTIWDTIFSPDKCLDTGDLARRGIEQSSVTFLFYISTIYSFTM